MLQVGSRQGHPQPRRAVTQSGFQSVLHEREQLQDALKAWRERLWRSKRITPRQYWEAFAWHEELLDQPSGWFGYSARLTSEVAT